MQNGEKKKKETRGKRRLALNMKKDCDKKICITNIFGLLPYIKIGVHFTNIYLRGRYYLGDICT